jgi:hypothetical protein
LKRLPLGEPTKEIGSDGNIRAPEGEKPERLTHASPGQSEAPPWERTFPPLSLKGFNKTADYQNFVVPLQGTGDEHPNTRGDAPLSPGLTYLHPFQGFFLSEENAP